MLGAGDQVPEAGVCTSPGEWRTVRELAEDGPALLLFYLFDWTGT